MKGEGPEIGQIVQYRVPKKQFEKDYLDYPAIIYKVYSGEEGKFVGITVFLAGIPTRFGKVAFSAEPAEECWSLLGTETGRV